MHRISQRLRGEPPPLRKITKIRRGDPPENYQNLRGGTPRKVTKVSASPASLNELQGKQNGSAKRLREHLQGLPPDEQLHACQGHVTNVQNHYCGNTLVNIIDKMASCNALHVPISLEYNSEVRGPLERDYSVSLNAPLTSIGRCRV